MIYLALTLTLYMIGLLLWDAWSTHRGMNAGVSCEANHLLIALERWIKAQPWGGPWLWLVLAKAVNVLVLVALWLAWWTDYLPAWSVALALVGMAGYYTKVVLIGNYVALKGQ